MAAAFLKFLIRFFLSFFSSSLIGFYTNALKTPLPNFMIPYFLEPLSCLRSDSRETASRKSLVGFWRPWNEKMSKTVLWLAGKLKLKCFKYRRGGGKHSSWLFNCLLENCESKLENEPRFLNVYEIIVRAHTHTHTHTHTYIQNNIICVFK